jgi:uncharacterized membrane protein
MKDLGTLGGSESRANNINDAGQEETPLIADELSRGLSKYPSPAKLSPRMVWTRFSAVRLQLNVI